MAGLYHVCLVILGLAAHAGGNVLKQNSRDRRFNIIIDNFSLLNEMTFEPNGDCTIFGHYLQESTCRWVLREKYAIYRFYYMTFMSPNPHVELRVEMYHNGSCIVKRKMLNMEECRSAMGITSYDQAFVKAFGLPDIAIDDQGYCMMGDTELAPEDCPVMIGEAVYTVLVSMHSYS